MTVLHAEVSVVVVSHNTAALLERCLASVAAGGSSSHEIIVVDNASTDCSVALVRERFPQATLVPSPVNLGFAAGVNLAASLARGRYLLLLNPDAALHPGAMDELVAFAAQHPGHGVYGGRIVTDEGTVDPRSCWGLPSIWSTVCFGLGLSTAWRGTRWFDPESLGDWPRDTVREVGAISGALMLVDAGLWRELGGFEETYFMYSEDIDLCVRAHAVTGRRPLLDPAATATHDVGASSTPAGKAVMVLTGKVTFLRRHWSSPARGWGLLMLVAGVRLRAAATAAGGRGSRVWPEVWDRRREWLAGYPPPTREALAAIA